MSGCVGAKVVTSVIPGQKTDDGDEGDHYVILTGSLESVQKATDIFQEKVSILILCLILPMYNIQSTVERFRSRACAGPERCRGCPVPSSSGEI